MARRRLLWYLSPTYILITILCVLMAGWLASRAMEKFYFEQAASSLETHARFAELQLSRYLDEADRVRLDPLSKELGKLAATRITVILPSGKVVADSAEEPDAMDNHADRPEVIEAMKGGRGLSIRFSHTVHERYMYVARPIMRDGKIEAVIRTAVPITPIKRALRGVHLRIGAGAAVMAFLGGALSLIASRRISRSLGEMQRGAERFAHGELGVKLPLPDSGEMKSLAEALNHMAGRLAERIGAAIRERNEHEAVLASMVEGVVAVDAGERLISMNQAAARLFEDQLSDAFTGRLQGRSLQEVIRNADLHEFVRRTLASGEPVEGDIILHLGDPRYLQAHGTVLRDSEGRGIGALVVLNDVTRLRRLENVRREFAANVSHELKTPVTSIKGFVETLLDGALSEPEEARRFLRIVATHADRLNAIIDDILSLSRIEQEAERNEIAFEEGNVRDVLLSTIAFCQAQADQKQIRMSLSCDNDLVTQMNAQLLGQAVQNLIDNAIKYSESGSEIHIGGKAAEDHFEILVRDQGCGIEPRHLPRLFERFYRVDKARSRKAGGTGLGLAITKHIAQAHGGSVSVESQPGRGSVFSIHLPRTR